MAFLSEKDTKVVGEKLGTLLKPATLAVVAQEFESDPGDTRAVSGVGGAFP